MTRTDVILGILIIVLIIIIVRICNKKLRKNAMDVEEYAKSQKKCEHKRWRTVIKGEEYRCRSCGMEKYTKIP